MNSDTGYADTNLVQFYDHPAVNERYGVLFNDHRHQIKLRGSYKLNDMWSFGATLSALSGGPITAFGVRWPNDNRGRRSRRVQRRRFGLALRGRLRQPDTGELVYTPSAARSAACRGSRTWAPT